MSVASSAMVAESHAAQAALLSEQHHRQQQQQQQQQQQHQHSQHDNGQLAGIHHIMHHTSSELHGMDPSVALQGEVADLHGDPAIIEYTQRRRNGRRGPAAVSPSPKPPVGSADWHRVRRENHKEVERRRREAINEGITALAKIVPGCERAKGSILARAAEYIEQLKETSTTNIEKWTLEKLLTDQAINDLTLQVNTLEKEKEQLEQRVAELEAMAASSSLSTRMAQVHDRRNDGALDDTEIHLQTDPTLSVENDVELSSNGNNSNGNSKADTLLVDTAVSGNLRRPQRKHPATSEVTEDSRLSRKKQHI